MELRNSKENQWKQIGTGFGFLGLAAGLAVHLSKKKFQYDVMQKCPPVKAWKWCVIVLVFIAKVIYSYYDWNGFKVLLEFKSNGAVQYIFQYLYYAAETMMFMLIIIFGQLAFEKWFHNDKIPYGGIVVAFTWGLAHWFTKGSMSMGIGSAILGFCYGSVYLFLNRNVKWNYLVLFLLFIV